MPKLNLIYRHPRQRLSKQRICKLARRLCTNLNFRRGSINILFTTNREIRQIHKQFMGIDTPTDCITFADADNVDIVISLDQAAKQAKPRGATLFEEVALLICHCLLHAQGYDDLELKDRLVMRQREFETLMKVL